MVKKVRKAVIEGITEKGVNEKFVDENGEVIVKINPYYFRPTEVDVLLADYSKAKKVLGWEPCIKFKELVKRMTEYDLNIAKKEAQINYRIKNF